MVVMNVPITVIVSSVLMRVLDHAKQKIALSLVLDTRDDFEVAVFTEHRRRIGIRSIRLRFGELGLALDRQLDLGIRHRSVSAARSR